MISKTPNPPYFAVIFSSIRTEIENEYSETAQKMEELTEKVEGFLGLESARNELGITVSYWQDLEAIKEWKNQVDHKVAQERGKKEWYLQYKVRIAKVEQDYDFGF